MRILLTAFLGVLVMSLPMVYAVPVAYGSGLQTILSGFSVQTLSAEVGQSGGDTGISSHASSSGIKTFVKGSLVGTLFFGHPFEGVGFADVIVAAILFFIGLKLVPRSVKNYDKSRQKYKSGESGTAQETGEYDISGNGDISKGDAKGVIHQHAASAWGRLRSAPAPEGRSSSVQITINTPKDFDAQDFLEGAKMLYSRLQASWAERDIADLEPFTTPEMIAVLKEQASEHPHASPIDVVLVNARLINVERKGREERAKVFFSALIHEDGAPFDVKELWHFVHNYETGSTWLLDAIEPVNSDI